MAGEALRSLYNVVGWKIDEAPLRKLDKIMDELKSSMLGGAVNQFERDINGANTASKMLGSSIDKAAKDANRLGSESRTAGTRLQTLGSALRDVGTKTNTAYRRLHDYTNGFDQLRRKADSAFSSINRNLMSVGRSMFRAPFSLPGMLIGGSAIYGGISVIRNILETGTSFDSEMSNMLAVTGASINEFNRLRQQARDLGATTAFSPTEAAEGQSFLGMAGFTTDQIISATPGVLNLALAGRLDMGTAADISSNILTGFNKEAGEMDHVSDVLAKSAASANTNIQQMGYAMSYVAPIAQGLGIEFDETAAAVGLLSNAGIQGERAGTALRGMIAQLVSPTKSLGKTLNSAGLSISQVDPRANSLSSILQNLTNAGFTAADAIDLVGVEAGPGLAALLTVGTEELDKMAESLRNADGAAGQMASTMQDNLGGDFKNYKSALDDIKITIFDTFSPYLRNSIQRVTSGIRSFGDSLRSGRFNDFGERLGRSIEGLASIAVQVGRSIRDAIGAAYDYIDTNYLSNPEFQKLPFNEKIAEVTADIKRHFDNWYNNEGRLMIETGAQKFVDFTTSVIGSETNIQTLTDLGVKIGTSVASGMLSGLDNFINEHPILGGTVAGLATPGPAQVKIATGAATMATASYNWLEDRIRNWGPVKSFEENTFEWRKDIGTRVWGDDFAERMVPPPGKASGLPFVPGNDLLYRLHYGERVLTAQENKEYTQDRYSGGGRASMPPVNITVQVQGGTGTERAQARAGALEGAAAIERYFESLMRIAPPVTEG